MASCLMPNFHSASIPPPLCDPANILWASSLVSGLCAEALPGRTYSPTGDQPQSLTEARLKQIYNGFLHSSLPSILKCFSKSLTPLIGLFMAGFSALILSCAGDASAVPDHGYNSFFSPALFGRPLAATIDLRVELMTKDD